MPSGRAKFTLVLLSALAASALLASCAQTPVPVSSSGTPAAQTTNTIRLSAEGAVRPGIEVFLSDLPPALRGKRVGLITNHTGIDREQ